jgi:PKD repeat protein
MKFIKLLFIMLGLLTCTLTVQASLPNDYVANYKTTAIWADVLDIFVQIQAHDKTGNPVPPHLFVKLAWDFDAMFPHLPQRPDFKIVYEKCKITTAPLTQVYTLAHFITFKNQCYTPLNGIITQINAKYTVSASASANPNRGNVPLTVTLDGRWSTDPTRETIPETNYYRSMRDIDGVEKVLGIWPIINHTFTKPGDYIINFVVRSPRQYDQGIFDWQQKISVKAEPQIANISVYLGAKKLDPDDVLKISTTEVQQGVTLDGSSTSPRGGRVIVWHRWDIRANGINPRGTASQPVFSKTNQWSPSIVSTTLPTNGRYRIRLTITDNQWATTYQDYILVASDPVAIIKSSPKNGNTSSRFTFDAGASYSVISKIQSYTWEIYDQQGQKIDTFTDKSFNKQFLVPGLYTIKLVVSDMNGKNTQEQIQVPVDSTPPIAQYTIDPSTSLDKPSEFVLDGSNSSDVDIAHNNDNLTYTRIVLNNAENSKIVPSTEDPEQAIVTFEKKWTYKVKLTVKDQYNKTDEITKEIKVSSALRPQVEVNPISAPRWTPISFSVKANKEIKYHNYDFWDGTTLTDRHQSNVTHTYKKTGIYKVRIKVISTEEEIEENIITTNVFVTNKDEPSLWYKIIKNDKFRTVMNTSGTCPEAQSGAYTISRYQSITLDTSDSVNSQGKKDHLTIKFIPQNEEPILKKTNLTNYKFDELWCQYIDIVIEDTNILKSAQTRVRFDVQNTPPRIWNLKMSFPQYGNEIGIGFSQGRFRDIFSTNNPYDPLIVKIVGNNIRDPDGYVKYLIWYYYHTDDPDRRLLMKTTPPSTNFVYFSMPRIAGEYSFGVEAIDNDGAKVNSQDLIWNGPIVFFPPEKNDADIPFVNFKVDQNNIKVWEVVNFEVTSRIVNNKQDFESSRTIRYDFDGDGEYDLTTKDNKVAYVYEKPWTYKPKVKVTYRGKSNRVPASTEEINVEQGLKTDFLYTIVDKTIIIKNTSIWAIKSLTRCMDMTKCLTDNSYVIEQSDYHHFTYQDYGRYVIKLEARDEYGNMQTERKIVTIQASPDIQNGQTVVKTIPEGTKKGNNLELTVGKQLKNTVIFYVSYQGSGQCFIDTNILIDSNYNGKQDDDKDIPCNETKSVTMQSAIPDIIARVSYQWLSGIQHQDILINLIDSKPLILDKYKDTYNQIDTLTKSINATDEQTNFMKTLLLQLKSNLWDKTDTASIMMQIQDLLDNGELKISQEDKKQIHTIISELSDAPVIAAQWWNDYDTYKSNIRLLLKGANSYFQTMENANGDQKVIKAQLDEIYKLALLKTKSSWVDAIDMTDFEEIKSNLCQIANYYQVTTKTCWNPDLENSIIQTWDKQIDTQKTTSTVWSKIVKIILVILGVVALVFLWLIVIFAIKAKKEQKQNEWEEDDE